MTCNPPITVNGCFILGLDGHTPAIFDAVYEFVERTGLYEVQITVMTAFPGTPLYRRLRAQGRVIRDGAWNLCTLFDVNHQPKGMSVEELRAGMRWLSTHLYSREALEVRRRPFFEGLRRRRPAA